MFHLKLRSVKLLAAALLFLALRAFSAEPPPRPSAATKPLFDGRTLAGWEGNPKLWRVQEGALTGGSHTETMAENEFLATTRDYTNFIVRLKIKLTGTEGFINSGFQIRSQRVPNNSEMSGYQCDYGDPTWWGCVYDESRRNKVLSPSDMASLGPVIKRQDWNEYVIRADGPRITTWINGVQGTDYTEDDGNIPDWGKLGIQVHGGGKAMVQVKDITIEELPATPPGKKFIGAPEPKKSSKASPLAPDDERTAFTLPPGFEIELVASESEGIGKFVTVDWDQKGRMWSMTALEYPVDANENPAVAKELYSSKAKDKVLVWDTPFAPGPQKPRVFADGLAIPLGILPYKNGVYVQHGPDIAFLTDNDGDGRADRQDIVLSGFGVQDSHLFPHQFTRGPGNWIWMAQGAFNYGKVRTTKGREQQFDQTRMARFRYDGSDFDITSQGPCNIWGLVLTGEGECFIQEANDYGYPVMPFHTYANYPGCSDSQFKSYAPEFPGTAPDFQMGGTGLSGLALSDKTVWPEPYADIMYVANPITRKIQAIKIHRDGPRYRLQKLPDFVLSSDEMFRPVSIHFGPDGCLYIVDWYNKIISHNEVPRNHPDRDKKRGRIWRVKHIDQKPFTVPDFTKLSEDELLAKLGGESLEQHHLAWQTIVDRQLTALAPQLKAALADKSLPAAKRVGALWALEGLHQTDVPTLQPLLTDASRNVRREAVRALGEVTDSPKAVVEAIEPLANDSDPEVRAEVIRTAGPLVEKEPRALALCVALGRGPLAEPTMRSTANGRTIKVREAYEREFERYLVRLFLEQHPQAVTAYLDSDSAQSAPLENRLLASLALDAKASALRVAQILPQLTRPPGQEEALALARFIDEASAANALKMVLDNVAWREPVLESLLKARNQFDSAKLVPLLNDVARSLWGGDQAARDLSVRMATGFKLTALEPALVESLSQAGLETGKQLAALRALREIGTTQVDLIARLAKNSSDLSVRDEVVNVLANSKEDRAPGLLLDLWTDLAVNQRRVVLDRLTGTKSGAQTIVSGLKSGTIAKADLNGSALEKLQVVLGNDSELSRIIQEMASTLRPVLRLDGNDNSWAESDITLDGPFTVETWIKLDPGIDNNDSILGAPEVLDMNFFDSHFRVWVGGGVHDAIVAKKKISPETWTHLAVTRDETGKFRIYVNGELDADDGMPVPKKFEHLRIGWSGPGKGTSGDLTEFRVWNRSRTIDEIRGDFDRSFDGETKPEGLVHDFTGSSWGKLHGSAQVVKISDLPALLTAAEAREQAEKFAKFRKLAEENGDLTHGKTVFAAVCMTCHSVGGQGAQIGPVLNGAGASGIEALLRNVLTPNAAMEAGYRVFRVELRDGDVYDGIFLSQNKDAIVLRRPNAEDLRIPQKDIRRAEFTSRSMMPDGLLETMSKKDATDLLAYLKTLR